MRRCAARGRARSHRHEREVVLRDARVGRGGGGHFGRRVFGGRHVTRRGVFENAARRPRS